MDGRVKPGHDALISHVEKHRLVVALQAERDDARADQDQALLDVDVVALHVSELPKPLTKGSVPALVRLLDIGIEREKPDAPDLALRLTEGAGRQRKSKRARSKRNENFSAIFTTLPWVAIMPA